MRNEKRLERNKTRLARNETRGGNLLLSGTVLHARTSGPLFVNKLLVTNVSDQTLDAELFLK